MKIKEFNQFDPKPSELFIVRYLSTELVIVAKIYVKQ